MMRRWSPPARGVVIAMVAVVVAGAPGTASASTDALVQAAALRTADAWAGPDLNPAQWALAGLGITGEPSPQGGKGVVVAVVSDGITTKHPELSGNVIGGWDTITRTPYTGEMSARLDAAPVGTAVAGLVAARAGNGGITGVAPAASIMPIRVESPWTAGDALVAAGIDWAVDHAADLVVLAPGSRTAALAQDPQLTCRAIAQARQSGVAVLVPAANDLLDPGYTAVAYNPASCPGAVVVAGFDHRLGTVFGVPNGGAPDFAVPATRLVTAAGNHDGLGFVTVDGVAYATGLAGGAAALVVGLGDVTDVDALVATLRSSAVDIGARGHDGIFGAGAVDLAAATSLRAARPVTDLRAAIDDVVAPRVLQLIKMPGGRTAVSWDPPNAPVTGYTVEVRDADGTVMSRHDVPGRTLRAVVPATPPADGSVTVQASVRGQLLGSIPVASSARFFTSRSIGPAWVLTSASATWNRGGLRVEAVGQGSRPWTVTVYDADTGLTLRTSTSKGDARLIKVPAADGLRARAVVVDVTVAGRGVTQVVAPQFGITASVRSGRAGVPVIDGSALAAVRDNEARPGDVVRIVDHSTGRRIATTVLGPAATFSVALPVTSRGSVVEVVLASGAGSLPITVPKH